MDFQKISLGLILLIAAIATMSPFLLSIKPKWGEDLSWLIIKIVLFTLALVAAIFGGWVLYNGVVLLVEGVTT